MSDDKVDIPEDWNMAKAYLQRLDFLLSLAVECKSRGKFAEWEKTINNIYVELDPKMSEDERAEAKTLMKAARIQLHLKEPSPYKTKIDYTYNDYEVLNKAELYLRRFMERKSLLTPKGDDPRKSYS